MKESIEDKAERLEKENALLYTALHLIASEISGYSAMKLRMIAKDGIEKAKAATV